MKNKKNILFFFLIQLVIGCGITKDLQQNEINQDYFVYAYLNNSQSLTIENGNQRTNNPDLNNFVKNFEVVWMMQSFPNAKTAELQNIYEIHFQNKQWNKDRLKTAFSNLNLFDKIEFANYYIADNQLKREGGHGYTNSILTSSCPEPLAPVNDLYVSNNWVNNDALNLIEANCAWTITKGDPSIVVGIADTEFDDNHEDLKNQIIHLSGNYTAPPECEHGTIVAGCVAAETNNSLGIAGIGYNTKIAGYKVYSYVWYDSNRNPRCGGNPWSGIWQAFQDERPIINVSWTGIGSPPNGVVAAAQEIVDGGTILVLGAGNSPNSNSHSSYANIPGVINVSGVDANNQHGPTGHAHNQWVDLCALSTNVTSTYRNDNYGGGWGTSFAAPQVAGVAALILSVNPCLTPAEVEDILKTTTEPISDASSYPNGLGTGRVNAYRAIEKAANLCIENQNITSNSDFESYILCTKNIDVQNNSELELRAVKQVNIFDSFTLQAGTKLEIFVDESYQINCQ